MARRGYTMAELMIVVIIMLMLVAAALPIAKKVMDDSHVREASRQLQAYMQMAKSRAVQAGRPCGVYLQCDLPLGIDGSRDTVAPFPWPVRHVTEMRLAEVPAPYSGSYLDSVATVSGAGFFNPTDQNEFTVLQSLMTVGETFQVRFDYKGEWYSFRYDQTATTSSMFPFVGPNLSNPPTGRTTPYQIRRSPRIVGNPLAMPTGTCIDLSYSSDGPAAHGYKFPTNFQPPLIGMMIMFTPAGGVDAIYFDSPTTKAVPAAPTNTLFFLVGRVDKAVSDPTSASFADIRDSNLADPTSLWLTVGRGNGQVTTSENTPDPTIATAQGIPNRLQAYLRAARSVATSREQMKGR